ncbi:MAG: class I SAM-dependent methyltransferase [Candidatus Omnitrophica bacterium]|nr:class I SAM-dependent methyltransferase [Candidatus Omnitrophota bacterium]
MANTKHFDRYLTTARFTDPRDPEASRRFYDTEYAPYLPADKKAAVLDVGCGMGEFMAYLADKGYENVCGVDVSPEMADHCRQNGIANVELIKDLKEYLARYAASFDLITLNDTLEHLPKGDTVDILKGLKAALKTGGALLLRTVNFSTPGGMYIRYKDFTHEIAYTECSLEQVLRMAGFEDIKVTGNRYPVRFSAVSLARAALLRIWFFILKMIYLAELGCDRPKIYSKILIAVCRN